MSVSIRVTSALWCRTLLGNPSKACELSLIAESPQQFSEMAPR